MSIVQLQRFREIEYPETDGEPVAENTLQFEYIVTTKGGLDVVFRDRDDVFVAGDLFWYPREGHDEIRVAPDVMVVFGRPKGHRGSYQQWLENNIAPQVVFEIVSPGNRAGELTRKFSFYEEYGVEEYYIYDPDRCDLSGWLREGTKLREVRRMDGWTSPLLRVRFDMSTGDLRLFDHEGRPFATYVDLAQQRATAVAERDVMKAERDRIASQLAAEQSRSEKLAAQLKALGVDPGA